MSLARPALRVLVVEDEALIALDLEMTIEDAGHIVAGQAMCLESAEALDDTTNPDLALVDLHLAHGTSGLDVSNLIQRRWPQTIIVFVTANPSRIPEGLGGAHGVLTKPFSHRGLTDTLSYLTEGILDPPPHMKKPEAFNLSSAVAKAWMA